jgi:hypothetical protein
MPSGGHNKIFSPDIAKRVIELYSIGTGVTQVAKDIGVDPNTIQRWRLADSLFDEECSRAQELGFEVDADSLKTIPDEIEDVQKAKLKSDNIKWLLARRAAYKYGDRIDLNVTQTVDIGAALTEAKRRVLPPRYPEDIEDAQVVDTKQITTDRNTGCEPVAPTKTGEEDIFG